MKHTVQHTMTLAKYLRKYRHFNIDSFDRESNDSIADLSSAITSIENDCVLSFDDVLIDPKNIKNINFTFDIESNLFFTISYITAFYHSFAIDDIRVKVTFSNVEDIL